MAETKTTEGTKTDLFTIKTIQNAYETLTQKAKTYGDKLYEYKYVKQAVDTGKEFGEKLYEIKYVKQAVDTGKEMFDKRYTQATELAENLYGKGKEFSTDARVKVENLVEKGKEYVEKIPYYDMIEQKVTQSWNTLPNLAKVPTKDDIDKLVEKVLSLVKKESKN